MPQTSASAKAMAHAAGEDPARPPYEEWLAATGNSPSLAAQFAYEVICLSKVLEKPDIKGLATMYRHSVTQVNSHMHRTFLTLTPEEKAELRAFRYASTGIDLLQLATMCGSLNPLEALLHHGIFDEGHYRGSTGLVNHPVHLACSLGHYSALSPLLESLVDIRKREGVVTVTLKGDPTSYSPVLALPEGSELVGKILDMVGKSDRDLCLAMVYREYCRLIVRNPRSFTASMIEFLWEVLEKLGEAMQTCSSHVQVSTLLCLDVSLMVPVYQRVCALEWGHSDSCRHAYLDFLHDADYDNCSALVSYMRKDQLLALARELEVWETGKPSPQFQKLNQLKMLGLLTLVRTELKTRTLQKIWAVAILQKVGGISVKLLKFCLPSFILKYFDVPFKRHHDQLKRFKPLGKWKLVLFLCICLFLYTLFELATGRALK